MSHVFFFALLPGLTKSKEVNVGLCRRRWSQLHSRDSHSAWQEL